MSELNTLSETVGDGLTRLEVRVPLSVYPLGAIKVACFSLHQEMRAEVVAEEGGQAIVQIIPFSWEVTEEIALRLFRRELMVAAVNRQARLDDVELQRLFANSAYSVTTERMQWLGDLTPDSEGPSPNVEQVRRDPPYLDAESPGYTVQVDESQNAVELSMDSRRFLLPVLLMAAKVHRPDLRVMVANRNGYVTQLTLRPRGEKSLQEVLDLFLGYVKQWELPAVRPAKVGTVSQEDPIDPALLAASAMPGHPARPGSGLPITYFRTVYGWREGISLPYRLNEIFTMQISPETYLVSTRHRTWAMLTREQYRSLVELRAHEDEDAFLIYETLGLILTRRNTQEIARLHAQRYSYMHRPPGLFIMVPTNRCNMGCDYCHAEAGQAGDYSLDMKEETAYKAVDYFLSVPGLEKRGELHIEFQGGECLLRWDLVQKVMDYADVKAGEQGLKTRYTLCTNLTTMTDEIAAEIVRRGNVHISTSLDGPAEVNDRQRIFHSGAGTHEKSTYWSQRLRDVYGIKHGYLPTLTKNNLGHEIPLVDEYRQRETSTIYLRYVNQVGRAFTDSYDVLGLSPDEYVGLWRTSTSYVTDCNLKGERLVERKTMNLLGNMLSRQWSYMCLRRPCGIGVHQVVVDERGDIYGCDQARSNPMMCIGNVHTHNYDEAYTSETSQTLRSLSSELYPKCRSCALNSFCGYCVVRGARQHGTPQPKMPEDFECSIYVKMLPEIFRDLSEPHKAMVLNTWVS